MSDKSQFTSAGLKASLPDHDAPVYVLVTNGSGVVICELPVVGVVTGFRDDGGVVLMVEPWEETKTPELVVAEEMKREPEVDLWALAKKWWDETCGRFRGPLIDLRFPENLRYEPWGDPYFGPSSPRRTWCKLGEKVRRYVGEH